MSGPDAMRNLTCDEVRELAGAYVLGALDAAATGAMRAHLVGHEDAHPEIAELGSVIPAFNEMVPMVEPPAGLKDRIMAAAAADLAARGGAAAGIASSATAPTSAAGRAVPAATGPAPAPAAAPATTTIEPSVPVEFPSVDERAERRARTSTSTWLLRIAAVLVIAALGSWNLLLQNQLGAAQAYERNVAAVLDAAAEPGSLTAVLASEGTGSGLASVQEDGDLAIAMRDLAPTTGNSVYEAWVIGADGIPVPVGNFRVGDSGIGFLEAGGLPSAEGITLALTLEPGPGANTPTLPIISAGVAGAPG